MRPSAKGEIAAMKVVLRAIEKGAAVSRPVLEDTRYDLILDYQGKLYRAQVKYCDGSSQNGAIPVRLVSSSYGRVRFTSYSAQEIDVVLAYVPKLDAVLWIDPCDFEGRSTLFFRLQRAVNNQSVRCRPVEEYVW